MSDDIAISLQNVSKVFKQYHRPVDRLKEMLFPGKTRAKEFWALQDINLEISKGETVGIIGRNGSGKSTLLQIIAGTLQPTTGNVRVNGRISALLELGSGFNPEFTGRQNVFFNGRLLGLTQEEIENRFDDIAAFADIREFIEQPVKTYSSGMFVRLAFAVAINVDPNILIVDEALSVGDGVFVHKCISKVKDFQQSGGTILFVSHDTGSINRLCSHCIWINGGYIVERGLPIDVSKSYQAWVYTQINEKFQQSDNLERQEKNPERIDSSTTQDLHLDKNSNSQKQQTNPQITINAYTKEEFINFPGIKRSGTGRCEITSFRILDALKNEIGFCMPNQQLSFMVECVAHDYIEKPIVGIQMFDTTRTAIVGWNSLQYKYTLKPFRKGNTIKVIFEMCWPHIKGGNYTLEPAVADGDQDNHEILDWLFHPVALRSGEIDLTFGLFRMSDVHVFCEVREQFLTTSSFK